MKRKFLIQYKMVAYKHLKKKRLISAISIWKIATFEIELAHAVIITTRNY